jgi:phosphate transport system protein
MSRKIFDQALGQLQESVLTLGAMAEGAQARSVELLQKRDFEASRDLIQQDRIIDEKRYAVEADALTLIATQAPLARDMRAIAAGIFIANELERIADYAKGIARVNLRIGDEQLIKPLVDLPRMAALGQKMLKRSLQAYLQCDAEAARAIILEDDAVDARYDQVYAELMTLIMADPSKMRQANLLLMAAHNLERTADRATNVCERVIYVATGELLDAGWEDDALG